MSTNQASVIQWNCRGLRSNFEEMKGLIADYKPHVGCLQETFLKYSDNLSCRGFNIYNVTSTAVDGRPIGGSSVLVKKGIPHEPLTLNTTLQAVAVSVSIHRTFTICSIYIPPRYNLNITDLDALVSQLPTP